LEQCCSSLPVWKQAYIVATNQPELGFAVSQPDIDSFWNLVKLGISTVLLSLTLVGLAVLGHLQGVSYRTYKCEPEENMFFLHLMPLPMFATLLPDLSHHFAIWNASEPITFFGIITVPTLWWLCLLNVMTQHVCLMGVNNVTRTMGTLACTFATTVRKFISLIFSVLYFHSPFTAIHTTGAVFVFVGTYLFATAQAPNEAAGAAEAEKVKKD
jgi:UDP-xylose/UDP-N-acetylglucosamine transporter B4